MFEFYKSQGLILLLLRLYFFIAFSTLSKEILPSSYNVYKELTTICLLSTSKKSLRFFGTAMNPNLQPPAPKHLLKEDDFLVWYNSLKLTARTEEKYVDLFSTQLIEILLNKQNKDLKELIIKILKDN